MYRTPSGWTASPKDRPCGRRYRSATAGRERARDMTSRSMDPMHRVQIVTNELVGPLGSGRCGSPGATSKRGEGKVLSS